MPVRLPRRPARREARHERRRRHDARAKRLEQLHDAVRHAVEIRHRVLERDLHRERATAHQGTQQVVQLAPRAVGAHLARKARERLQLDAVRHRYRLPAPRQEDEEPAGPHAGGAEDALGHRVHPAKVVQ